MVRQAANRIQIDNIMSSREDILNQFYTEICDEDQRLMSSKHSRVEFITTIKYINEYLSETSRILEIGAGTGRYSLYYAEQGYDVTAIEYIESNLVVLESKIKEGMHIDAKQGDAVDLIDTPDLFSNSYYSHFPSIWKLNSFRNRRN